MFSCGIRDSSSIKSIAVISIVVLRSSEYLFLISVNSSLIICNTLASLAKISFKSAIIFNNAANSSSILLLSKPVNRLNFNSKILSAWIKDKLNLSINVFLAISSVSAFLIILITSSILSKAILYPSKIWTLFSDLFKSNLVLLIITSFW